MPGIDKTLWDQLEALIQNSQSILLTTHINADGDGLGSEIAFYYYLKDLDKNCRIINSTSLPYNYTVCYHDTKRRKPFPDPILLGLNKLQVPANKVLSLGDRGIDIIASKKANVKTVGCFWGTQEKEKLLASGPDFNAVTTTDLKEIFKSFYLS